MKAELITIGDEILIGQIVNTNAVYLSKELNKIGVSIVRITSISDNAAAINKILDEAQQRADIMILTGGLGPTNDDLTKHTLCHYFNDELVLYPEILEHIEQMFKKYVSSPINDKNREQALLPKKATIFKNAFGTASGMWFERNNKVVVALPGVPHEMKGLMTYGIIPELQKRFSFPFIYHKTALTYGLGESVIAERIEVWENALPDPIKLAYLPSLGRVRLRLSSYGTNPTQVKKEVDDQMIALTAMISDIFFGFEEAESLEGLIRSRFTSQGQTLALAESCTGGKLASMLTAIPGASAYFSGSAVTYSAEAKKTILGVSEITIASEGIVSEAVAAEMALGAKKQFKSDYALSTTGNAGPTAGDPKAPLGTVCMGWATPTGVQTFKFQFGNHREKVVRKAVNKALEIICKEITKPIEIIK